MYNYISIKIKVKYFQWYDDYNYLTCKKYILFFGQIKIYTPIMYIN